MWKEVPLKKPGSWPPGVRLPIIISVHHQSEEACVMLPDGQVDPRDYYERQYGGRRGAWRLLEIMSKHNVLGTWIICGATCEKYPDVSREVIKLGHSIAGHGYAHEAPSDLLPHQELEVMRKTVRVFEDMMGHHLRGWRTCAKSHVTLDLLLEHFDFQWDASVWNDDLPYLIEGYGRSFMEVPFSVYSDAAYSKAAGNLQQINRFNTWEWNTPDVVAQIMRDQFDALYERGAEQAVLMPMTVHDFITGRPSRAKLFDDFLTYAKQHEGVVFTTHDEVRKWWLANYQRDGLHGA
ncbi:MAG TPA: polysaccharide deacetylase family protein [Hyphomicrobiaceae bacterium]|nr:polysaccharide deacetylase family protein [Hyphomicrobiaceae bacterium]